MNPLLSIRLDALRAAAALAVFVCHFSQLGAAGGTPETLWALGRIGVVTFFVMSGFVIAYAAECREPTLADYLQARLARLYSVFLPALLLTALLDLGGRAIAPHLYWRYPEVLDWRTLLQVPVFAAFLFENSWFSLRWLSNGPMWSIAYEFWYYVLFGLAFYQRGRAWPLVLAAVAAGWKTLLLAPIWLIGVALYRFRAGLRPSRGLRAATVLLSVATLGWLLTDEARSLLVPLRLWGIEFVGMGFQSSFLCDYLIALPVSGLMFGLVTASPSAAPRWGHGPVLAIAGCSFTLYLLHVPLILLLRAAGLYDPSSPLGWAVAATLVLGICWLIARGTEHQKLFWRARMAAIWRLCCGLAPVPKTGTGTVGR